jgi:hypothetical protein
VAFEPIHTDGKEEGVFVKAVREIMMIEGERYPCEICTKKACNCKWKMQFKVLLFMIFSQQGSLVSCRIPKSFPKNAIRKRKKRLSHAYHIQAYPTYSTRFLTSGFPSVVPSTFSPIFSHSLLLSPLPLPRCFPPLLLHRQKTPLDSQKPFPSPSPVHPAVHIANPNLQIPLDLVPVSIDPPPALVIQSSIPSLRHQTRLLHMPSPLTRQVFSDDRDRERIKERKRNVCLTLMRNVSREICMCARPKDEKRRGGPEVWRRVFVDVAEE